jgi:hypothetical protein
MTLWTLVFHFYCTAKVGNTEQLPERFYFHHTGTLISASREEKLTDEVTKTDRRWLV